MLPLYFSTRTGRDAQLGCAGRIFADLPLLNSTAFSYARGIATFLRVVALASLLPRTMQDAAFHAAATEHAN